MTMRPRDPRRLTHHDSYMGGGLIRRTWLETVIGLVNSPAASAILGGVSGALVALVALR